MRNIHKIDEEEDEEENTKNPFKLVEEVKKNKSKKENPKIITEESLKKDLECQINFLEDSNKNIISLIKGKTELASNPFFQFRLENNGINLYLINIFKKVKMNDIISLTNNLKANKETLLNIIENSQKKISTLEHEINFITQEKIDAIIEKERLSDANETLNASILETMNQSNFQNERINPFNMSVVLNSNNLMNDNGLFSINRFNNNINNNSNNINNNINVNDNVNINKKISDLKDKFIKLSKKIDKAKRSLPEMKKKLKSLKEKNNVITHQIKQKKMIYDQINEELESLKEEAEKKRKYNIQKKSSITSQNSGTSCESKKSKVGRFLKGLFG